MYAYLFPELVEGNKYKPACTPICKLWSLSLSKGIKRDSNLMALSP